MSEEQDHSHPFFQASYTRWGSESDIPTGKSSEAAPEAVSL